MAVSFLDLKAGYEEMREQIDSAVHRVLDSGHWVLGSEVREFEREFAEYCGVNHCIGLANGLEAIHLLLRAEGIGPGDEVIVPSNTYIASWLGVTHVGATVVPVEPDERTYNLDPERIERAITKRTKAIMPVHLYGQPADIDPIAELAERYGLRLFDDCAQGHGARYKGRKVGSLVQASCFSFYPSKNLGAIGDAGAVTTNDDGIADRLRVIRNYGSRVRYYNEIVGYNSRLDELQAAILREKLKMLDIFNDRRRQLAQVYLAELEGTEGLVLPRIPSFAEPCWHLFVVRVQRRDYVRKLLEERGIQTIIHYPVPPHLSDAYAPKDQWGELPLASKLADEVISLPMGPQMSEDQVREVCVQLKAVLLT